ncbi:MAG TPA: hypothetical protein DCE81_10630 [Cytophagales bacterium]|nr:hypothetical protein [Cytophagales bacterium]
MGENKKVFFVINKFSGTGYSPQVEGLITDFCAAQGWHATLEFTKRRGHAVELAQRAVAEAFDVVVAMGGDGTVNEVAQAALHQNISMAILPKGSGNGLARHLGIPLSLKKALTILASRNTIQMDALSVNNRISVNVSGIGFDGHIANLFDRGSSRGFIGYARLVLREYFRYPEAKAVLTIDGKQSESTSWVMAFANSSQFGNNARIAPRASVCDGVMDVGVVRQISLARLPRVAWQLFTGRLEKCSEVTIRQAREVCVLFEHPRAFHIDGEASGTTTELVVKMLPGAMRLLIPETKKGKH